MHPPSWSYEKLRHLLTNERLASYFADSDGSTEGAFALYEWNMRASAAIMELTSMVEVIVRNSLDECLREWATSRAPTKVWFDIAPLDAHAVADVAKARDRASRRGKDVEVHGKVIAELTLGFWRFLVESRYFTSLWVPATHRAFSGGPTELRRRQTEVARRMKQLTFIRNRAAHHEPIHRRHLGSDLTAAIELAAWVSADAGAWVAATSSLASSISARPHSGHDRPRL